jgi:hypothetical protein
VIGLAGKLHCLCFGYSMFTGVLNAILLPGSFFFLFDETGGEDPLTDYVLK